MINKEEIFVRAKHFQLFPTTIEKDYVLSWVLYGISSHPALSKVLIFKGGTALKKCYFGDYRFSEDLDFTLKGGDELDCKMLSTFFEEVCEWVNEASGIEFIRKHHAFEEYTTPRGNLSIQGKLRYRGPLGHKTSFPKIKIDITRHEILVSDPVKKKIIHNYSDELIENNSVRVYSIEEIFAEKIRALIQRARPRDLYDVINLNTHESFSFDKTLIRSILKDKCEYVNILYPSLETVKKHKNVDDISSGWENMLAHQIASLKPMKYYWDQLPELFEWL